MMLLGVDAGSVAVSLALLSGSRGAAWPGATPSTRGGSGRPWPACCRSCPWRSRSCWPAPRRACWRGPGSIDGQLCQIAAARRFHGKPAGLLVVGGERFTLFHFQEDGGFRSLRTNSSCAAGTGSFLDQQARRLGLAGSAELAERAQASRGSPPVIASRCSVFAKTDLSHAQASGYSLEAICDGLCLGLARNIADTVGTGLRPAGGVRRRGGAQPRRAAAPGNPAGLSPVLRRAGPPLRGDRGLPAGAGAGRPGGGPPPGRGPCPVRPALLPCSAST